MPKVPNVDVAQVAQIEIESKKMTKEAALAAYVAMVRIRAFEEACARCYREGKISGFCHLYTGQEAVVSGFHFASEPDDAFITSYRCHAHALIRGESMTAIFAELFGRSAGSSKGKGGSMHVFYPEGNFFGGHGIVGAQVPIGAGLALARQYKNQPNASFVFMGDGALNQGQVYESFNMSKLLSLPVVYIIENNMYAMGTSIARGCANAQNLHQRGVGFGIKGLKADGMSFLEMRDVAAYARDYALKNGPIVVEAMSYRYRGHSMSDPAKYRTKEEVEGMKNDRDSIANFGAYLVAQGFAKEGHLKDIALEAEKEAGEARDAAMLSPEPDLRELYTDVY